LQSATNRARNTLQRADIQEKTINHVVTNFLFMFGELSF